MFRFKFELNEFTLKSNLKEDMSWEQITHKSPSMTINVFFL